MRFLLLLRRLFWTAWCCLIWGLPAICQDQAPFFKHLNVEDGLSNNWVRAIHKDEVGFMWFGTFNGLNRYDGQQVKVFRMDSLHGLTDNFINSLAQGDRGSIWVGTFSGGLNRFDPRTEQFQPFRHDPRDPQSLRHDRVNALLQDRQGQLWVGTQVGLDRFDPQTGQFHHLVPREGREELMVECLFEDHQGRLWLGTKQGLWQLAEDGSLRLVKDHLAGDAQSLAHPHVKAIYEDKYGMLWIGTWGGGLDQLDPRTAAIKHFQEAEGLGNLSVLALTGDGEDQVFIATEGGGLYLFDLQQSVFRACQPDLRNSRSISSNSVHSLYYDPDNGLLWAGSYNSGVDYFSKWDKPFMRYQAQVGGLNNHHVTCVAEDQQGRLWIGTDGGGVNVLDPSTGTFRYLRQGGSRGLQSDAILSILCDRQNQIWVGSYSGGLDLIRPGQGVIRRYTHDPADTNSLSGPHVSALYEDKRGNLWVGTMTGGLNRFDPPSQSFHRHQPQVGVPESLGDHFVYGMCEDRRGRLLVQTGKGLEAFDYKTGHFERYTQFVDLDVGVPISLLEDSQGNLWVGSKEQGLFRVDRTGLNVRSYTTRDGLPNNSITGILEDRAGNLWISTQRGLCQLEEGVVKPDKVQFRVYSVEDGLQGSEFKRGACCKRADGTMVFGGQNGFNLFDPIAIKTNPFVPPVVLTGLKLFNKEVPFGEGEFLPAPITTLPSLTLGHDQSVVTFNFAGLSYMLSEQNQYAFRMEGFEDTWNQVGTQSHATYTNLDAGTYLFRVRAANHDGIWNEAGTRLHLTILPPWWESWYFQGGMLLLALAIVVLAFKLRTMQLKRSQQKLTHQVALRTADLKAATAISEERQTEIQRQNEALVQQNAELARKSSEIERMAEEIRSLNEARIRFFTNISHELRTPLNLILWPLEELMSTGQDAEQEIAHKHRMMHLQATKLIKLINQLLDFRKLQAGTLDVYRQQGDVMQALRDIFAGFQEWAKRKEVSYRLVSELSEWEISFDADKLDKILSNLLSNAFKFVAQGGHITLTVSQTPSHAAEETADLLIAVQDDGKGIDQAQLKHIFQRFYEAPEGKFPGTAGSGIGLALVKELVELQEGSVWVESEANQGATFFVQLPTHFPANATEPVAIQPTETHTLPALQQPYEPRLKHEEAMAQILIVEDNPDIQTYIGRKLGLQYEISYANNGQQGWEAAIEHVPDVIISDVMMPVMDGFEMCQMLKTDPRTSHIPIMLLTARSGEESQEMGLSIGADDYLTKPFPFHLLELKVKNILYTRDKLREQFLKGALNMPTHARLSPADQQFLDQAATVVRERLPDSTFGVEDFSAAFHMSRRNVLRKMKGITGLSINEYIRHTRLQEAHQLLEQGELNVSEVAYSVGFTDPKYFSACFKKQFGRSPSDIRSTTA